MEHQRCSQLLSFVLLYFLYQADASPLEDTDLYIEDIEDAGGVSRSDYIKLSGDKYPALFILKRTGNRDAAGPSRSDYTKLIGQLSTDKYPELLVMERAGNTRDADGSSRSDYTTVVEQLSPEKYQDLLLMKRFGNTREAAGLSRSDYTRFVGEHSAGKYPELLILKRISGSKKHKPKLRLSIPPEALESNSIYNHNRGIHNVKQSISIDKIPGTHQKRMA